MPCISNECIHWILTAWNAGTATCCVWNNALCLLNSVHTLSSSMHTYFTPACWFIFEHMGEIMKAMNTLSSMLIIYLCERAAKGFSHSIILKFLAEYPEISSNAVFLLYIYFLVSWNDWIESKLCENNIYSLLSKLRLLRDGVGKAGIRSIQALAIGQQKIHDPRQTAPFGFIS